MIQCPDTVLRQIRLMISADRSFEDLMGWARYCRNTCEPGLARTVSLHWPLFNTLLTLPRAQQAYPLTAALLGLPDTESESDEVPTAWLEAFEAQHVDSAVLLGLFTSCRAGRAWSLTHARRATLRLDTADKLWRNPSPDQLQRQLAAAAQALATRGARPTALHVLIDDNERSASALQFLSAQLQGTAGSGITELTVTGPERLGEAAVARCSAALHSFLQHAAAHLPALTTLTLKSCACVLPPPQTLPSLTSLVLHMPVQREPYAPESRDIVLIDPNPFFRSVSTYLPQLTALTIDDYFHYLMSIYDAVDAWHLLFRNNTTHTLRELSTDSSLSDWLVRLLVDHAPGLERLSVWELDEYGFNQGSRQWGVRKLTTRLQVDTQRLVGLPAARDGSQLEVCSKGGVSFVVRSTEGLPEDIVARLPEWQFTGQQVSIWPHYRDIANPTDHPTALAHTLTQVAPLKAPGSELRLCGWCWQLDTARAAAAALLAAPELRVTVVIETLTDEALGAVLILGTQVRKLAVKCIELETNTQVGSVWPWEVFAIESRLGRPHVQLDGLLRLPSPASGVAGLLGHAPVVEHRHPVELGYEGMPPFSDITALKTWLSHIRWRGALFELGPIDLHAHIALLNSITHADNSASSAFLHGTHQIKLEGLRVTADTVDILAGLPGWAGTLLFDECTYELDKAGFEAFGAAIPTSVKALKIFDGLRIRLWSVCAGLNRGRAGLSLPPIMLRATPENDICGPVGDHVILSTYCDNKWIV